jgi:hypothetical protein
MVPRGKRHEFGMLKM